MGSEEMATTLLASFCLGDSMGDSSQFPEWFWLSFPEEDFMHLLLRSCLEKKLFKKYLLYHILI